MTKTKTILFLIAASLVIMASVGVTYAQYVNAQNQNSTYNQTPTQGYTGNYVYLPPHNGNGYSQIPQQGAYPYGMGMGMGMMYRRNW